MLWTRTSCAIVWLEETARQLEAIRSPMHLIAYQQIEGKTIDELRMRACQPGMRGCNL